MRYLALTLALLAAPPAFAECPAPADISVASTRLLLELREADTEGAARAINAQLWDLWLTAPDADAQALLNEGTKLIRYSDFAGAEAALNRLVDYCPDYAEGYNQRAFAAFLQADYDAALADLDLALDRSPTHLGALSGKALTLMGMGRNDIAQDVLREALALNPWLPERRFLIERPGEKL
ncbi:MAG: hypothetical protein AAGM21_12525 [Pseudomonadota bacterium]